MAEIKSRKLSSPFLIGLFVIVGLLIMVGVVIWLGATQFLKENVFYVTYFNGSVEGLTTGSAVKYQGVPVGAVKEIKVAPDGKMIEIIMQIGEKIVIDDSLRVKSEYSGIAGGKFLQLHYPSQKDMESKPDGYKPLVLNFKPPYKVINSSPSGIEELEIEARKVMDNLKQIRAGDISNSAVDFMDAGTRFITNKELFDIIAELHKSAVYLNSILEKADSSNIINNLNQTTQKLYSSSAKLEQFTDSMNYQIANLQVKERLDTIVARYKYLMDDADGVVKNADGVVKLIGYRTESVMYNFNDIMIDFKATNRQLRKTLKGLTDNPSSIFLAEPPPPEK